MSEAAQLGPGRIAGAVATCPAEMVSTLPEAFLHYRPQLAAFLRARRRGNAGGADIEDLLQDLWLRCRNIDAREVSDLKSYLFRAAHNLAINRSISDARGRTYEEAWYHIHSHATGGSEPATAERRLLAREHLAEIERALLAVGVRASWIFKRYRLDGMMQAAIADELGVSLSTVEKDLRKAYEAVTAVRDVSDDA